MDGSSAQWNAAQRKMGVESKLASKLYKIIVANELPIDFFKYLKSEPCSGCRGCSSAENFFSHGSSFCIPDDSIELYHAMPGGITFSGQVKKWETEEDGKKLLNFLC